MWHDKSLSKEIGVVCLVPEPWGPFWQPRHQILSRLSESYNILWIEPSVEFNWRDLCSPRKVLQFFKSIDSHFTIALPVPWLPKIYRSTYLDELIFKFRLGLARRHLKRIGCSKIVLYIWRPEFARALNMFDWDASCYHVDDEYSFSDEDMPNAVEEVELIRNVDRVIIHSDSLIKKKGGINPKTHFVPNGVDYAVYASDYDVPEEFTDIPKPIIGYSGYLKNQLDWDLVEALSQQCPQYSFVFVGGLRTRHDVETIVERLKKRPNIYFLGSRPAKDLPRYVKHFDVCIMPYRRTSYTNYIYPLKLHEYLASGNPVVSTPINSVIPFGEYVQLAVSPDDWIAALNTAIVDGRSDSKKRAMRQTVAQSHDWAIHVEEIRTILASTVT